MQGRGRRVGLSRSVVTKLRPEILKLSCGDKRQHLSDRRTNRRYDILVKQRAGCFERELWLNNNCWWREGFVTSQPGATQEEPRRHLRRTYVTKRLRGLSRRRPRDDRLRIEARPIIGRTWDTRWCVMTPQCSCTTTAQRVVNFTPVFNPTPSIRKNDKVFHFCWELRPPHHRFPFSMLTQRAAITTRLPARCDVTSCLAVHGRLSRYDVTLEDDRRSATTRFASPRHEAVAVYVWPTCLHGNNKNIAEPSPKVRKSKKRKREKPGWGVWTGRAGRGGAGNAWGPTYRREFTVRFLFRLKQQHLERKAGLDSMGQKKSLRIFGSQTGYNNKFFPM